MKRLISSILTVNFIPLASSWAQESPSVADKASEIGGQVADKASEIGGQVADKASEIGGQVADKAVEVADRATELANSEQGLEATDTILEWIAYAEKFYQPWMNWALVAIGIGLFVSHAGQLVVGKLWGLLRGRGFNFCESFNDLLVTVFSGLALPAVIVISTPVTVLTAAAVGILIGMALYTHGMKQEALAAESEEAKELAEESA